MSLATRRRQLIADDSGDTGMWIPGLGENKPRPRELGCTMFGYIPDAFSNNLPTLPSESSQSPRSGGGGGGGGPSGTSGGASANVSSTAGSSRSSSPRPDYVGGRRRRPRTADDSSQMRDALVQPVTPDGDGGRPGQTRQEVQEEPCVAVDVRAAQVEAQPFFDTVGRCILIQGGTVVNDDGRERADVLVGEDGIIAKVGEDIAANAGDALVIDATDKLIMPGGVDPSVHFYDRKGQLAEDFESGTLAALAGGTTTVVDLVMPDRDKDEKLTDVLAEWRARAEESACCDVAFRVAVPRWDGENTRSQLQELAKHEGVNGFKLFLGFKHTLMLTTSEFLEALEAVKDVGGVACVHAENGDVVAENEKRLLARGMVGPEGYLMARPEEVEEEAITRAIALARQVNVPLIICGPTGRTAVELVARARSRGQPVWVEVTAASIALEGSHYYNSCWRHAAAFVCAPPLRDDPTAPDAIVSALAKDHYQIVCSDDHSYTAEGKEAFSGRTNFAFIPPGLNGAEDRLGVAWERGVEAKGFEDGGVERFVAVTSANAARALNLYPRKGRVAAGSDADLVVWNVNNLRQVSSKTHRHKADFNVFEGLKLRGAPEFVIAGGRLVVYEYQLSAAPGSGKVLSLTSNPSALYDVVEDLVKVDELEKQAVKRDQTETATKARVNSQNADPLSGVTTPRRCAESPVLNKRLGIYQRPMSAHGVRNQQDSTFSLAGGYNNDPGEVPKASVKVNAPPGGQGRGSFW